MGLKCINGQQKQSVASTWCLGMRRAQSETEIAQASTDCISPLSSVNFV